MEIPRVFGVRIPLRHFPEYTYSDTLLITHRDIPNPLPWKANFYTSMISVHSLLFDPGWRSSMMQTHISQLDPTLIKLTELLLIIDLLFSELLYSIISYS